VEGSGEHGNEPSGSVKLSQLRPLMGLISRYSYWLRAGRLRVQSSSPGKVKIFLFSTLASPALGPTQPPVPLSPGVKRSAREADHSTPTSAEVKKTWIYTSTPPYVFMV
jgi:hypothetical protein